MVRFWLLKILEFIVDCLLILKDFIAVVRVDIQHALLQTLVRCLVDKCAQVQKHAAAKILSYVTTLIYWVKAHAWLLSTDETAKDDHCMVTF